MGKHPISFDDWVQKVFVEQDKFYYGVRPLLFLPQVDWLKNDEGIIDMDRIIRFEQLNEEFPEVAKIIGIDGPLPHLNAANTIMIRRNK